MVDRERNSAIYDLYEAGHSNIQIAKIVGETQANISIIIKKIKDKNLDKETFINSYRKHDRTTSSKRIEEVLERNSYKEPKYQVGEIIKDKYRVLQIFRDITNRYLVEEKDLKYKEMFFENDI